MSNFDFLKQEPQFAAFADVAISAEKGYQIDPETCAINCRRAMESAIKWMYSVDSELSTPYQATLISLMTTEEFQDIVGRDLLTRMHYIRKLGNNAAHTGKKIKKEQAQLCLENLHIFFDFISYCYGENYQETRFNPALL